MNNLHACHNCRQRTCDASYQCYCGADAEKRHIVEMANLAACPLGLHTPPTPEELLPVPGPSEPLPSHGVGTEIAMLIQHLGIAECAACAVKAEEWNRAGVEWCEAHADELTAHLIQQAKDKNWVLGVGARWAAPQVVAKAIENAKANHNDRTENP